MGRWIDHFGGMLEGCVQFASAEPCAAGSVVVPVAREKHFHTYHVDGQRKKNFFLIIILLK